MIPKYRNWGVGLTICASAMTVLFLVALRKGYHVWGVESENWAVYALLLYFVTLILWMLASLSLAKAKGYAGETMRKVFVMLFFIGFCCPGAMLIFPLLGFFVKDKIPRSRRRSRQR